jgi:hypothetical protein
MWLMVSRCFHRSQILREQRVRGRDMNFFSYRARPLCDGRRDGGFSDAAFSPP